MRLFIDTSKAQLWQRYRRMGWVYGATTNPLILKKEGRPCTMKTFEELVAAAKDSGLEELQIQAIGKNSDALFSTGMEIARLWQQVVVKVPLTRAGLQAATRLIDKDIRVTMTAAYAAHQMIAASAMGAHYIAPYYGRLKESGIDADQILAAMLSMKSTQKVTPRILVASIRTIDQLQNLAANGHDTFTLNPELAEQFAINPLSDQAAQDFEAARSN